MRHSDFIRIVEDNPIIAAVKDDEGLEECLRSEIGVVFILYGNIGSIIDIVKKIKRSGKLALVHMDLVSGMQAKDVSVDYIRNYTEADGIITTKVNLLPRAKELGLNTISPAGYHGGPAGDPSAGRDPPDRVLLPRACDGQRADHKKERGHECPEKRRCVHFDDKQKTLGCLTRHIYY